MDNKNLLKCCKAVLDFLNEEYYGEIPTPKQNIMNNILIKNGWVTDIVLGGDMAGFTEYLNKRFQLGYSIEDEKGNMMNFFENHSRNFYKTIIRDLTINEIIEDEVG